MMSDDDTIENMLADSWLTKPRVRWSLSMAFIILILLVLKPVIVDRLISRAEVYTSNNQFNNVERECRKAIFLDGDNIRAWNLLGNAYKCRGDLTNAIDTYLNAININPGNKVAHFKVAMVYALEEDYNKAIQHFELIRILGPESHETLAHDSFSYYQASLKMLSLCYEKTGQTDKMNNIIRDLIRVHPENQEDKDLIRLSSKK